MKGSACHVFDDVVGQIIQTTRDKPTFRRGRFALLDHPATTQLTTIIPPKREDITRSVYRQCVKVPAGNAVNCSAAEL
jgi:hypothetical protein